MLTGRVVSLASVTLGERTAMLELLDAHYDGVRRDTFEQDLGEKQWVIQVWDTTTRRLMGFSTQMLLRASQGSGEVTAIFSGDTIMHPRARCTHQLAQCWGRFALQLLATRPQQTLYWFLICKGYKTYRFLPLFFHEFYPRYDRETPAPMVMARNALAAGKFGPSFDAVSGIIRAGQNACRLKPGVADLTTDRLGDPHVRFFARQNPNHAAGDELCCLAPLNRENFSPAAYRVIGDFRVSLSMSALAPLSGPRMVAPRPPGERGWPTLPPRR